MRLLVLVLLAACGGDAAPTPADQQAAEVADFKCKEALMPPAEAVDQLPESVGQWPLADAERAYEQAKAAVVACEGASPLWRDRARLLRDSLSNNVRILKLREERRAHPTPPAAPAAPAAPVPPSPEAPPPTP